MHPWIHLGGDVTVSTYFACIALGLTLATFVLRRQAPREGLRSRDAFDAAIWVIPLGAIGARLFLLFDDPARYLNHPWDFLAPNAGWVSFGALAGLIVAVVGTCRVKQISAWSMLDAWAPAIMFGHAFARMGCLAAGCCHGRPADWPLGIPVPWSVRYVTLGRAPEDLLVVPLHPSPLYEALLAMALFNWLPRPHPGRAYAGQGFARMLMGYGVGRAVLELFRGDLERGLYLDGWVSAGQATSAIAVLMGLVIHLLRRRTCTPS